MIWQKDAFQPFQHKLLGIFGPQFLSSGAQGKEEPGHIAAYHSGIHCERNFPKLKQFSNSNC